MTNYEINLREFANGKNIPAHMPQNMHEQILAGKISELENDLTGNNMTNLDLSYAYGLLIGIEVHHNALRKKKFKRISRALEVNGHGHEIDAWITELIQNAQDQSAKQIGLGLTNDGGVEKITFSHDGTDFTPHELSALMEMYTTTKLVDLSTVGRFGIGFKYWMLFFDQIEVQSTHDSVKYTLTDIPSNFNYNPSMKKTNIVSGDSEISTTFKFSNPTDNGIAQLSDGLDSFLEEKIPLSVPLLVGNKEQFSINMLDTLDPENHKKIEIIANSEIIEIDLRGLPDLTTSLVSIQTTNSDNREVVRFSLSLDDFIKLSEENGNKFLHAKVDEYKAIQVRRNEPVTGEEALEVINKGLHNPTNLVTVIYDSELNKSEGYFAQKFITTKSKINLPFILDGPFQLTQNREKLNTEQDSDFGKEINEPLFDLFGLFMDKIVTLMLKNQHIDSLKLQIKDLDHLVNEKLDGLGEFKGTISMSNIQNLIGNANAVDSDDENSDQDVTSETKWSVNGKYGCPTELIELWRTLYNDELQSENLDWFMSAINPELKTLSNPDLTVLLASQSLIDRCPPEVPWFSGKLGEGIPDSISAWIEENEYSEKTWKDSIVKNYTTQSVYFASEVEQNDLVIKISSEHDTEEESKLVNFIADFIHNSENLESKIFTSEDPKFDEFTTLRELIIKLFEMSRETELSEILQSNQIIESIQKFFSSDIVNSQYENLYLMKDNEGSMTLVEHPTEKLSPCILIGENGYEMVSIGKPTSDKIILSDINFDIKPRIYIWNSQENYLWYIQKGMDAPKEERRLISDDFWTYSDILLSENQQKWDWIELEIVYGNSSPKLECYILDSIALKDGITDEERYARGVFHDVIIPRNNNDITHERPRNYQQHDSRPLQNNSETAISKLYARVVCSRLDLPDSLTYTRWPSIVWLSNNYLAHAIVRITSVFTFSCANISKSLTPKEVYSLIVEENRFANPNISNAFDIYWYRGDDASSSEPGTGTGIKIADRRISDGGTLVATARLSTPNVSPEYRILSSVKGLPEQKVAPFWNNKSAVHYLIESSANGQLQLPRVVKTGQDANSLNSNICTIRPILIPSGEQYQKLFVDYSKKNDENNIALSRLIQSALDFENIDNRAALEWIENLVENGCNYWFNRTLKELNSTIENNTTCRVLLRDCGNVLPESYPKLFKQFSSQSSEDTKGWRQLVKSVRINETIEQIKDGFSDVRIPILESDTDGLRVSLDGGPKISELKDEHIMLVEWDENILNLVDPKDRTICLPNYETGNTRLSLKLKEIGWITEEQNIELKDLFSNHYLNDSNQVSDIQQNIRWINIRWINTVKEYLNNSNCAVEIIFVKDTEKESSSNFYSNRSLGFSVKTEDGRTTIYVHLPEENEQSKPYTYEELVLYWEVLSKIVSKETHRRVDDINRGLEDSEFIGPWSRDKDLFVEKYCPYIGALDDSLYTALLTTNIGNLGDHLEIAANMYRNNQKTLSYSKNDLKKKPEKYYEAKPSMLPRRYSEGSRLCKLRSIWIWALPESDKAKIGRSRSKMPSDTIGEYLLLNPDEDAFFGNSTDAITNYVFVDDYFERMYEALKHVVTVNDSNSDVFVKGLCDSVKEGQKYDMQFNKVHLIMILGGFIAGGLNSAN